MNTETRTRARRAAVFASLLLVLASGARADVVTEWNVVMGDVVGDLPNPAEMARTAVITQVAVFEAVNSIVGDYEPYRNRIKVTPGSSPEAATIAATLTTIGPAIPVQTRVPLDQPSPPRTDPRRRDECDQPRASRP